MVLLENIKKLVPARYLVLGTIDGVVACLAVVLGLSFGSAHIETSLVVTAGLSAGLGLGISNGVGGYMAEYTVEKGRMRKLERAMMRKTGHLEDTYIEDDIKRRLFFDTLTHGGCSFMGALVPILPFLLLADVGIAALLAIIMSLAILFILGLYMGKVTKEHLLISGAKMAVIGLIIAGVMYMLGLSH